MFVQENIFHYYRIDPGLHRTVTRKSFDYPTPFGSQWHERLPRHVVLAIHQLARKTRCADMRNDSLIARITLDDRESSADC